MLEGGPTENTMTIDGTHIKLEASTSGTENITDIQNYLDSFNKEIEGNEVTPVQTGIPTILLLFLLIIFDPLVFYLNCTWMNLDGDSVEHAYFIDQNVQYYYQTTTGDGQMVMVGGKSILFIHLKF